uniref:Protein lifeguard 1 n=1 Tax=Cacopsylla melanoneura TaxID=428564 RepID=A0A8D8TVA0_9HEMI
MSWQPGGQPGYSPYGQAPPEPGFYPGVHPSAPPPGYPPQGGGYPQPGYPQPGYPPAAGYPAPGYPPPNQGPNMSGYGDIESGGGGGAFDFSEKTIRLAFIRKVYSILMIQIGVSATFIGLFTLHEPTKLWVYQHPALFLVSFVTMFVTLICISCCESVRRTSPMNIIFLGIFTLAESFLLGVISSKYNGELVFWAAAITCVICLSLTIFAFQTKVDFTMMGGVLFVCVIVLFVFGIVAMFFPGRIITLIYGACGAVLFSIYLIYDTQLMMGGNHRYSISPEEYIFAALNIYLDVVNIFSSILQIFGVTSQ